MATTTTTAPDGPGDTLSQSQAREGNGHVFAGWRIWIAQRVPLRSLYIAKVVENGGQIVPLEQQADIMIADHLRHDAPPDTVSYRWLEACIAAQDIVPSDQHRAGPSSAALGPRPVGSASRPARTGRNTFTAEDDRVLYAWVIDHEAKSGGRPVSHGNEIYKQLEAKNARHPWQSWRDRYIRYLINRPRPLPVSVSQETPPTPPSDGGSTERRKQQDPPRQPEVQPEVRPATQAHEQEQQQGGLDEEIPAVPAALAPASQHVTTPSPTADLLATSTPAKRRLPKPNNENPSTLKPQLQQQTNALPQQAESSPWVGGYGPLQGQMQPSPSSNKRTFKYPFSIEEHQLLVDNVANIQASVVERYENMWSDSRIFDLARHSPEEWREYYETKILPDWKKLPNQVKQKRLSDVYERIDSSETAELLHDPQNIISTQSTSEKPRVSAAASQTQVTPSEVQKRSRDVIEIGSDSGSSSSAKRRRQEHSSYTAGDILGAGSRDTSREQPQPDFDVFEDRRLPDDEKENVIVDGTGSYSLPPRHVHMRSSEALEAFSDPLPQFHLQPHFQAGDDADATADNGSNGTGEENEPTIFTNELALDVDTEDQGDMNESLVVQIHTPSRRADLESQSVFDSEMRASHFSIVSPNMEDEEEDEDEFEQDPFETIQPLRLLRRREESPKAQQQQVETIVREDIGSSDDEQDGEDDVDSLLNFHEGMEQHAAAAAAAAESASSVANHNPANASTHLEAAPSPPTLFVSSPPSGTSRVHPTVSHITVRKELHENPHASLSPPASTASQDEAAAQPAIQPGSQTDSRTDSQTQTQTQPQPPSQVQTQTQTQPAPAPQAPAEPAAAAAQNTQDSTMLLSDFIAAETASGKYTEADILYALQRGNFVQEAVRTVLEYCARGEKVPSGLPGIWTEEDDEALMGGDARAIRRLEDVHGPEALGVRLQVLNQLEDY